MGIGQCGSYITVYTAQITGAIEIGKYRTSVQVVGDGTCVCGRELGRIVISTEYSLSGGGTCRLPYNLHIIVGLITIILVNILAYYIIVDFSLVCSCSVPIIIACRSRIVHSRFILYITGSSVTSAVIDLENSVGGIGGDGLAIGIIHITELGTSTILIYYTIANGNIDITGNQFSCQCTATIELPYLGVVDKEIDITVDSFLSGSCHLLDPSSVNITMGVVLFWSYVLIIVTGKIDVVNSSA